MKVIFLIPILGCLLASCSQERPATSPVSTSQGEGQIPNTAEKREAVEEPVSQESAMSSPSPGIHRDHNPKHGGAFFMALNDRHHLEGLLVPPGVFRVYLYDAHTQPVSRAELEQAQGKVIWGEAEDAPETPLKPGDDGPTLEATCPEPLKFPATLTLHLRLPGSPTDEKPELFTFPFSHYSEETAAGH